MGVSHIMDLLDSKVREEQVLNQSWNSFSEQSHFRGFELRFRSMIRLEMSWRGSTEIMSLPARLRVFKLTNP